MSCNLKIPNTIFSYCVLEIWHCRGELLTNKNDILLLLNIYRYSFNFRKNYKYTTSVFSSLKKKWAQFYSKLGSCLFILWFRLALTSKLGSCFSKPQHVKLGSWFWKIAIVMSFWKKWLSRLVSEFCAKTAIFFGQNNQASLFIQNADIDRGFKNRYWCWSKILHWRYSDILQTFDHSISHFFPPWFKGKHRGKQENIIFDQHLYHLFLVLTYCGLYWRVCPSDITFLQGDSLVQNIWLTIAGCINTYLICLMWPTIH